MGTTHSHQRMTDVLGLMGRCHVSTPKPEDKKTGKTAVEKLNNGIHVFLSAARSIAPSPWLAAATANRSLEAEFRQVSVRVPSLGAHLL
ncbi:hypothetical protein D5086_026141 [Populus alba]|uniref:Uncharacterized protein n=1 Tax=Populus alba TaxID=43335 RepID=A0ACC4B1I9_POPAL